MKNFILLSVLFLTQLTFAGPPPVSLKGQQQSTKKIPAWNLQVPFSQSTDMGGIDARIETGNLNLMPNPSFEGTGWQTGWTSVGTSGSVTQATGVDVNTGDSALKVFLASTTVLVDYLQGPSVTLPPGYQNTPTNMELSCYVNATSGGSSLALTVFDVTNNTWLGPGITGINVPVINKYTPITVTWVSNTGTLAVRPRLYYNTSSGTDLKIDDCYLGPARNIYQGMIQTPWLSYVPTITAATPTLPSYTLNFAEYRREGEDMFLRGRMTFTAAAGGWVTPCITYPLGLTNDPAVPQTFMGVINLGDTSGSNYIARPFRGSSTVICFAQYVGSALEGYTTITSTNPFTWASTDTMDWTIGPIKIPAWVGQSQTAFSVSLNPALTDNIFSALITSTGTVTSESADFITGNCTNANPAVCTFVASLFSVTPSCSASINGTAATSARTSAGSTTGVSIGGFIGGAATADGYVLTCVRQGADRKPNINIPLFTQSMVARNLPGVAAIGVAKTGACASSPCTVTENKNGMLTIANGMTRSGVGSFALNFTAGFFTSAPNCWCTSVGAANQQCNIYSETTSGASVSVFTSAGVAQDVSQFKVTCLEQQ